MEMCYDGALVMPSSYAVMDAEEMTYVEGGKYISATKCNESLMSLGFTSPYLLLSAAMTYTIAKKIINKVANLSGIAGKVVTAICVWASSQVIEFGLAIARGAINDGVEVTWNWNPFKGDIGVDYTVL